MAEPAPDAAAAAGATDAAAAEAAAAEAAEDAKAKEIVRAAAVDVHPPTLLEKTAYAIVRGLVIGASKAWFRLEVHGKENIPASGPFVLAPVHRSNVDFALTSIIARPRMRYMGKASIWKWAPLGKFVSMLGAFPVHRGTADRESLRTCMKVIENGESLVMFPEGSRRSGPAVDTLFDGPAYVAARAGVPLVPMGIGGTEEAMPAGTAFIKPRKVVLVVGEPIRPPQGDGSGRVSRKVVRKLTEDLYTAIQRDFDEAQRLAGNLPG